MTAAQHPSGVDSSSSPKGAKADAVISHLEKAIRTGELAPGDALPTETTLEKEFGVSRTVIREALQVLKGRGLIQAKRGSGNYVRASDPVSLRDTLTNYASLQREGEGFVELMDMRLLIETESARLAAGRQAPATTIRKALVLMERNRADARKFADADIAFHLAVVAASGNTLFQEVVQGLMISRFFSYARTSYAVDHTSVDLVLDEHRKILGAIEAGNPTAATRAMKSHLKNSRRKLIMKINPKGLS